MTSSTSLDEIRARLAKNLRARRTEVGLSQEKLALLSNVHRTYVSQFERNIGNPTLEVILKLANTLGVDIDELLKR
jgi:transcriptional regulator with XRE-family HTH domain